MMKLYIEKMSNIEQKQKEVLKKNELTYDIAVMEEKISSVKEYLQFGTEGVK